MTRIPAGYAREMREREARMRVAAQDLRDCGVQCKATPGGIVLSTEAAEKTVLYIIQRGEQT